MSYNIELCPIVNKGKAIHRTQSTTPSISSYSGGFDIPLMPSTCELSTEATYEVPLQPTDCDPFKDGKTGTLNWEQETQSTFNMYGGSEKPTNYWLFSCSIPQGMSEGTCAKCFSQNSAVFLYGNLGFNGGSILTSGNTARWRIHRDDLPFPGEMIMAIMMVPGEGSMLRFNGSCASPDCGALGSDCMWGRDVQAQTSGTYWIIASTYFATPTWTGGFITDYYTDDLGWAAIPEDGLTFPDCSVYGDDSLLYKIDIEGTITKINSSDFAGYGIGTFVTVKKLGVKYNEPFSDSCLGIGTDPPEQEINNEIIGQGINNKQNPSLSCLTTLPIDIENPPVIKTLYYTYDGEWNEHIMSVNVDNQGSCSGDCVGGKLNMLSGCWSQNIVWTNVPGGHSISDSVDIVCTYHKKKEIALEGQKGIIIAPWHIMGMGG